jgi:MFS family permease
LNQSSSLLDHRPFVFFWLARVSGTLATQMQTIAVGWQIYELTKSALDLGLVGLAQFIPAILFILPAGHFADRYDRRNIVRLCQSLQAVAMALLAAGTATGSLTRDMILGIVILIGAGRAFETPTQQALLPNLVPPEILQRALAGSASANQAASIAGPALGGLLLGIFSSTVVYALCAALFFFAAILISLIRIERAPIRREPISIQVLTAGLTFIGRNPIVLGAISLDLFAVLFGGAVALLPVYAQDIFQTGPWGLGMLRAAPGVGALCTAIVLSHWPLTRRVGPIMLTSVAIFGAATILFGISTSLPLSIFALFCTGTADMVSVVVRHTLVQLETPDAMRGRVSAVNFLFIGTSNQLGEFRAGVNAHWFGAVGSVVLGGIGTLIVVALWAKLFPALRNVDRFRRDEAKTSG